VLQGEPHLSIAVKGETCAGDTADTVTVAGETYYRILGRLSVDIIKHGGYKISALRIESVLLEHPNVKSVAVMGMPDELYGEIVACVCEKEPETDLTFSELLSWASGRLPVYELPRDMLIVETMPRNSMGKVNKVELRELFARN
jgi:malonyl-CoA/methylmalonyl-CoA synthetase